MKKIPINILEEIKGHLKNIIEYRSYLGKNIIDLDECDYESLCELYQLIIKIKHDHTGLL